MSAQESLSPKQFKLYRGINLKEPDTSNLGVHWTSSKSVAKKFARGIDPYSGQREHDAGLGPKLDVGHIIEAHVDSSHVVPVDSEEWNKIAEDKGIYHPQSEGGSEKEVTLRKSAPVNITRVHKIDRNKIEDVSKHYKGEGKA